MKKNAIILTVLFAVFLLPAWALAGSVEGSIQGYHCVTMGKVCPVGKEDPMISVERVFVVLTKGGSYYFVPNLDRAILARHLGEVVRVSGKVNAKFKSITANKLETFKKGAWKTAWTPMDVRQLGEDLGIDI